MSLVPREYLLFLLSRRKISFRVLRAISGHPPRLSRKRDFLVDGMRNDGIIPDIGNVM
jgi:hypothetical protein